jgi:hypothetical protein
MLAHEEKRILIEAALEKLQGAKAVDERETLTVEKWIDWYDQTIPLVSDIKIIASEMEIEMARRRGRRLDLEGEQRGRPSAEEKVTPGVTISGAERKRRFEDRLLSRHPNAVDEYLHTERKAGRIPTKKGARRHVQKVSASNRPKPKGTKPKATMLQRTPPKTVEDQSRIRIYSFLETLADGQARSEQEIRKITKLTALDNDFYRRIRLIPWLMIERTKDGTTFTIDQDLRAICEGRAPRPALGGLSIHNFLKNLRTEIKRRRKENRDEIERVRWDPDEISKQNQRELLNWIELELGRIP